MKLARPARRQHPETIIALIDVVFFLLVFFMLIGRMDATAPFKVDPPVSRTGADMPGGGLTVAVSQDGALALDGAPMEEAALLARLAERAGGDAAIRIRINAHRDTELRHVLPLVTRLEDAGYRNVMLVVTPQPHG